MLRAKINEKSLSAKITNLNRRVEERTKETLKRIAADLVTRTPVDTGAYAESFSVVPASSGGGRMKTSKGRPRNQSLSQFRNIALMNMTADIEGLQFENNKSVSFRNRSPYASSVESKYQVFGAAKDKYR